jgi:hypothetical protein
MFSQQNIENMLQLLACCCSSFGNHHMSSLLVPQTRIQPSCPTLLKKNVCQIVANAFAQKPRGMNEYEDEGWSETTLHPRQQMGISWEQVRPDTFDQGISSQANSN